jgi:hypothetical protein
LRDALPAIRSAGCELVAIGSGRPEQAVDFREREGIEFPLFVDPGLDAYRAAGLRRGVLPMLGPGVIRNTVRAFGRGARQGSVRGDPWQLGGVFAIRAGGELVWKHVSRELGDHPPAEAVIDAARRAGGGVSAF